MSRHFPTTLSDSSFERTALGNGHGRAFTLMELISVVAVIVVLLGALAPAVSGFRSVYERKRAVNMVMDTLETARVAAMQSGENVHVIFAQPPESGDAPDALMVVGDAPLGASHTTFHTRWVKLPVGQHFLTTSDAVTGGVLPSEVPIESFPPISGSPRFAAVTFNSAGQVIHPPDKRLMVALFEGSRTGGEEKAGGATGGGTANLSASGLYEVIELSRFTGRSRASVTSLK